MAFYSTELDYARRRIARRMAGLAHKADQLGVELRRVGGHTSRDMLHFAHDLGDQAQHQGAAIASGLGRSALRTGRAVGRDPVPAVVAVAGLVCLVSLVLASGRTQRRR